MELSPVLYYDTATYYKYGNITNLVRILSIISITDKDIQMVDYFQCKFKKTFGFLDSQAQTQFNTMKAEFIQEAQSKDKEHICVVVSGVFCLRNWSRITGRGVVATKHERGGGGWG